MAQDITTINPANLVMYAITGYNGMGVNIYGSAAATTASLIEYANALSFGNDKLSQLTKGFIGDKDAGDCTVDDKTGPGSPSSSKFYKLWYITNALSWLSKKMATASDDEKKTYSTQINAWGAMQTLNGTLKDQATTDANNDNKSLQSQLQGIQNDLAGMINNQAEGAKGVMSLLANLFQNSY